MPCRAPQLVLLALGLAYAIYLGGCAPAAKLSLDSNSAASELDLQPSTEVLLASARSYLQETGIQELKWGLIPYVAPDEIIARYSPIIARVSKRLGVPIKIVVGRDYKDLEELIVSGQVDIAVLGPYAYVRARKRAPEMSVFASHVALGSTTYGTAFPRTRSRG